MPDLTGMDVFEEAERRWPHLARRFVFISGGGVNERSRQFIERHAARLVTKPIDNRQLLKLLAEGGEPRTGANTDVVETSSTTGSSG